VRTASDVRRLSRPQLDALYASLRADRLPVGTFDGRTWPVPAWPLWRGKIGYAISPRDGVVVNRGGFWLMIQGAVTVRASDVVIEYPQLGVRDYLKPVSDTLWLGYLKLGPFKVWFTLERIGGWPTDGIRFTVDTEDLGPKP